MPGENRRPKKAAIEELPQRLKLGLVADEELRGLIRVELTRRLKWGYKPTYEEQLAQVVNLVKSLKEMPIAKETETLDSEFYQVPISFLKLIFGKTLKERKLQLPNVEIILADITKLELEGTFDRIVTVGLLEHLKNYEAFLKKVSKWMSYESLLFVDHVCHKTIAYEYEPIDEDDWYTNYTFPAGTFTMPSATFLLYFQDDVSVVDHWILNGKHVGYTMEEWLKNMDSNMDAIQKIMETSIENKEDAKKMVTYWRNSFMIGSELCMYNDGEEWMVSHVLFKKK